jgi:hypothetical protein
MGRINWGRVLLGGLAAGVVINISEAILNTVVAGDRVAEAMKALNLDPEGGSIAVWFVYGFLLGIVAIWLYAAIRPRFGPGPKTALIAGIAVWILGYLFPTIGQLNMGLFPPSLAMLGLIWGLVEVLIGTLLGARVYREEPAYREVPA